MKLLRFLCSTTLALCWATTLALAAEPAADSGPANGVIEQSDAAPLYTRQDVPGSVQGREVAEVTLDEIKPAFSEATVLALNAIVRRSLQAAGQYTHSIKTVRAIVATARQSEATEAERDAARSAIAELRTLHKDAVAARAEMDVAAAKLEASTESYSEELLAGMVQYTIDVEASLAREIRRLDSSLLSAGR
ncbi:MAG: hypothetical protein KDI71_16035 [Xanthomonadales bacterium]|nr:hypothetical protein [Xanthomonadales bacterium]